MFHLSLAILISPFLITTARPISILNTIRNLNPHLENEQDVVNLFEVLLQGDLSKCIPMLVHDGFIPESLRTFITTSSPNFQPVTVIPLPFVNGQNGYNDRPNVKTNTELQKPEKSPLKPIHKCEEKNNRRRREPCNVYLIVSRHEHFRRLITYLQESSSVIVRPDRDYFVFWTWDSPLRDLYMWFEQNLGVKYSIAVTPVGKRLHLERVCLWCDEGKAALVQVDSFEPQNKTFRCNGELFPNFANNFQGSTLQVYQPNPWIKTFVSRGSAINPKTQHDYQFRVLELVAKVFNLKLSISSVSTDDLPHLFNKTAIATTDGGRPTFQAALAMSMPRTELMLPPPKLSRENEPLAPLEIDLKSSTLPTDCLMCPFKDWTSWLALLLPLFTFSYTFHLLSKITGQGSSLCIHHNSPMQLAMRTMSRRPGAHSYGRVAYRVKIYAGMYVICAIVVTLYYMSFLLTCITNKKDETKNEDVQEERHGGSEYIVAMSGLESTSLLRAQLPDASSMLSEACRDLNGPQKQACLHYSHSLGRLLLVDNKTGSIMPAPPRNQALAQKPLTSSSDTALAWSLPEKSPLQQPFNKFLNRLAAAGLTEKFHRDMVETIHRDKFEFEQEIKSKIPNLVSPYDALIERGAELIRASSLALPMGFFILMMLLLFERLAFVLAYGGLYSMYSWVRVNTTMGYVYLLKDYDDTRDIDENEGEENYEKNGMMENKIEECKQSLLANEEVNSDKE